jgi:hypothetical protein
MVENINKALNALLEGGRHAKDSGKRMKVRPEEERWTAAEA